MSKQISIKQFKAKYKGRASKGKREEDATQKAFIQLMRAHKATRHVLVHSIPNEGKRSVVEGKRLKEMGLMAGTPDMFIAAPVGQYGGMYIEFKSSKGRLSESQKQAIPRLQEAGYYVAVHRDAVEAWNDVVKYLRGEI